MLTALLLAAALVAAPQEETQKKKEETEKAKQEEQQKQQERTQQQQAGQEPEPLTYEEVVVVTATKTEQPLVDSVSLVTAVTETDIEHSPALVIDDQLRRVPGFSLFRRSSSIYSHPTTQGVSLRGIGSSGASRSLVLWNEIPLNDPFGNWIYFNRLPNLSLRSVEVARGATSQLYGSSALGGTIQLLPRPVEDHTLDMRMQAGTLDTYDLDVFASDKSGDWGWIASGRVFGTEGYIQIPEEDRGAVDIPTNAKFQTFLGRLENRNFHVDVNLFNEKRSNGTPIQQNDSQVYMVDTGYDTDRWSFNFYGQSEVLNSDFSRIFADRSGEVQTSSQHYPSSGFGSSFTLRTDQDFSGASTGATGAGTRITRTSSGRFSSTCLPSTPAGTFSSAADSICGRTARRRERSTRGRGSSFALPTSTPSARRDIEVSARRRSTSSTGLSGWETS